MMTSPAWSRGVSVPISRSTNAAGNINHTWRGGWRCSTNASRLAVPTAPWPARDSTAAGWISKITHSCPARSRRWTMLAPMRPRPIIPSCIQAPFSGTRGQRVLDHAQQRAQACLGASLEVDAQHAAAVSPQRLQLAQRLGPLELAERVRLASYRHVDLVVGRQQQVDARAWTTLVELTGRVEIARPVAGRGRDVEPVA